jgi:hypothetical protein
MAAQNGSLKACALLMEAGADISIRRSDGFTPLQIARHFHPGKRELHSLLDGSVPPSQCGAKCDHCGKPSMDCRKGLNICICGGAFYCCRACQTADWARHEPECKRLEAEREKAAEPTLWLRNADGSYTKRA